MTASSSALECARMATARAHLAGAESAELQAELAAPGLTATRLQDLSARWLAARRRYWRELAGAALLTGWNWAEAEALGREGL